MPMNCHECDALGYSDIVGIDCSEYKFECRASCCPLVNIPTPHGDLIDREEAMKGLHTICVSEIGYSHRCIHPEYVEFAPTVIEGEA